jgi:NADH:ubiquinone oxidoreductase subunit 5 (subunit L)/multisubunit Na+/H+ antiporter MnhA subunit
VSEWLIYSGLLRSIASAEGALWLLAALAVPGLALTGGLALACFAKVVGVVFLGTPRQASPAPVREARAEMLAPMVALALMCAAIGVGAFALGAPLAAAAQIALAASSAHPEAPFAALSLLALGLLALVGAVALGLRLRLARSTHSRGPTWDCGYAAPGARMQYSASSFAAILVRAFAFVLTPQVRALRLAGIFPAPSAFHSHVPDAVLDGLVLPASRGLANLLGRLRVLQQGSVHAYLLYVWIALVALLAVSGAWR